MHIQPSEIDKMNFWEYEYLLEDMKDMMDKEGDNSGEGQSNDSISQQASSMIGDIKRQSGMDKMPSVKDFKAPQIKMPKL